ncbi:LPD38 domain-containing protein [Haemophilus influenzae]|uniref:MuF-C-terminal domain-containing protein n=1 Tax=Haemophilus influenzae TaxID=727 RepID=UPI0013A6BFFD|nr:LPD38 domain-containing protein [Haemophilus influenzae]
MSNFYLPQKEYDNMIGIMTGNPSGKKKNDITSAYVDMPMAEQKPEQQGLVADTIDAVQMGAWKGASDIAHGLGALTGMDWLHDVGDWAAKGADENLATMSDEMKTALNQNAFDGEDQGVRNIRWWAGNLGSLIGQNLDTVLTLGAGKVATFGVKQAGKLFLKKEAAEQVGKTAVEQAAKRGIPQKYWNMVGVTAVMSAMSGGSRYGQKRDEVMGMSNEQLAQIPQFSDAYYEIADSEEGKGKTVEEIYDLAKSSFADKVGSAAALNPTAIATDLVTNAVSGLGGGFLGLSSAAKTIKGGLLKGAMVEGGTEAVQGIAEQYALNKAEKDYYNPNKDLTEGMADNAINGAVLGGVFGSAMGGLDAHTEQRVFNKQKRVLLNHIDTGNEAVDSQLRNYVDMLNQGATELSDLVSVSRVQALNNAGIVNARARQAAEDALAQQQAKAKFESDFFGEDTQQAQDVNSAFQVDPKLERALELHSILGQFRNNNLSRANEFMDTPMVFSDEQAKKDHVTEKALTEVRNIAQQYGINPQDGKAMRQWLEDYAEKAKEYGENQPHFNAPTSNLQSEANIAPTSREGVIEGVSDEIDVGNGNYQPFQYEVVDATTLSPTQQKDDNQFRDRDRTASQSQINNIARNLDPRKLAASPTMDIGAPLLALDGKTIIAGNGRSMALRQAYQEGGAEGYRQFLKDNADRFGVDSAELDAVENPVLVRRLTSPVDIAQVAINSNEQGGMRMSELEQAKVDARRLPSMDSFVADEHSEINSTDNQQFIRQFIQNQPENLRNELLDSKGNLSQTGVQRIRNAMLYQAYGDSQTLSRLIENTDQGAKNVLNALTALAPKVAQTQQDINSGVLSDVGISNEIIQAVEKYNQLNAQGYKINDYLAQEDFVGDLSPEAREILTIFDENRRSGKRIAQVLGAYFDQAKTQGNLSQASIFGDMAFDKLGSLQQAKNVDEDIRLSLNESADSDFAKAVDYVANGKFSSQIIDVGTTPSVLKMLGLPDANVVISGAVLKKIMLGKHNVTPDTLKQLPKQINDPVAVMKSSTQQNGYVVLTELMENVNGINKPVVSALHLKQTSQGIELINIASVYGRNNSQIQRGLENDLLYWNKKKGANFLDNLTLQLRSPLSETNSIKSYQFARTAGLQLPSSLTSVDNLSVSNIKTEADLSQYQSAKNNQESSISPEVQRVQAIINKTFGKAAQHIEVTTFANPPKDVKNLITSDVEGWFNPKTGKITIVADSIKATKTMTKDERLQFVAWHEMAHRGINVGYKGTYDNLMTEVGKNKMVSKIADAIQVQRKNTDDLAATNRAVAIEEAIAEVMAAHETGKWNELESRYGVEIKKGQRQSTKSWLAMTAQRIKEFLSKIFGAERAAQFSDEDVLNLVANIKKSAVGNFNESGNVRFSRNEDLTEELYNQAKENGETELTFHQWKQVRSPEFKAWFGDWENDPENASKVVNPKTGEPLVVYHGTLNSFNVFSNDRGVDFVSDDPKFVDKFVTQNSGDLADGANVMPLFISAKNPFDYTNKKHVGKLSARAGLSSSAVSEIKKGKWQRIEDRTIIESIKDLGFDGFYVNEDGVKNLAIFNSNQIKSASSNTGVFSSENDDIRFSRKGDSEYQRDLIVTHNISADGIMHANKMGGLPLASVAVAKQSNPLTNFGEVTLIGSRDYIDPKGVNKAQVFGSDIYSPRYPRVSYEYSAKDKNVLFNRFEKAAKEVGDGSFDYYFTQGLEDTGARQAMLDSDAVKYQFLKEQNIPYKKAHQDIPKSVHADYPSIQKAIKAGISEEDISSIESADKFEGLFREFIKDYIKDIEGRVSPSPSLKNVIVRAKQALDGDKYAVRTFAESRVKEGLKLQESKKVLDSVETLSNMRKAVSEHENAFRDYVDSIVETIPVKEKIWNGTDGHGRNKYVAHTIENVVKKLKKDLRGGESFNYGMPNVRAAVTPKFKSIADIQANKHRIVSKEEFEIAKNTLKKEGDLLANKLGVSTLDIYDVLWNAVDENTSKAFGYAGIRDTQENRMAVDTFLNKLKALPTEYFEGKAKDITQFSNFAGAVVPDNLAKNAYDVLEKSGVKIFTYDSTDPKSRIEAIKQATNQLDEERGGDILFSRANTMQSALDLAMTGVADSEPSVWDNLKSKDFSGFKERFNRVVGKVDEWFADSLRPVNDWIDSMHLEDQTGNTSSRDHEKRRLKDAMYTAKGKRDALNSELEQAYLKPILSKIAALSKETKKSKHPIDELTMKRLVGNWISARYSIEKNIDLLNRDEKVMRDTKRLLDNARQNGTSVEVRRLNEAYLKAKEQYDNRKSDIYNTDYKNKGNRFKVGVAGGWSIPEAELIMKNTEQRISKSNLESIAEMVYDLNQSRLDIDRASGRYTESEYQEYKSNRHYVPLTGDPNADVDVDIISGASSNALNITRDKALKGRINSEAEDAIDAVWKSIGKSTTYAGFAEFKSRIDDLFETEVTLLKDKGYSDAEAREQATANLGISKRKMQGLTRSSDNVLIRKEGSDYYEYELPTQVMESLRNDNVEHANAFLKVISKPTGWYARGVTQWTVTFAPMNMLRDTWEKSEFIRVQKLYDKNNRLVDSKTMDKIGRDTIKNALADKEVWQATKRLGFGQELRDSVPAERMLKQLLKEGGVSNYGTYLDKTETDLIKRLKKENNPLSNKLEKVGNILEGYNKTFDTVSALAAYKALVENGVDSKQAAATTLELTNFRKTGSKMRGIKALYMFSQPAVMGAANLMRYLSTRKGQYRFAAYLAGMTALYTVLRSMDDEDEGGNKMDQLGDITRFIPFPLGDGYYFKFPVGFGMPQMAWNFATNIVKGAVGDISLTEAGTNMLAHSLKTFAPISPSEISAAKYPMEKAALTITPTLLQPLMQNVVNRSAFGNKITTNYVRDDKLKAEQSKATTAQFWKDVAINLNDTMGIDMHPEQIKNLFDGYSSILGSLKELNTVFVENPNREELGRKARTPFLNQFIGTTNEFAIQSRYYEASEEAGSVYKEYKSRKERNELGDWLDANKMKLIKFHEQEESIVKKARSEKANLTRALRSGKISAIAYENGIKRYNKDMSRVQAKMLRKYRIMEGLNTN